MMSIIDDISKDDRPFQICFIIILSTSCYIAIASLALEMIIMMIVMILMVFTLIPFICWAIICPSCLSWRPRNNGDIDRDDFIDLLNQDNTTEDVLVYLFRNNKKLFKKPIENKNKKESSAIKEKAHFVYPKEKGRLNTDRSENEELDQFTQQNVNTILVANRDEGTINENKEGPSLTGILSK